MPNSTINIVPTQKLIFLILLNVRRLSTTIANEYFKYTRNDEDVINFFKTKYGKAIQ